jgi:hypothetical protein
MLLQENVVEIGGGDEEEMWIVDVGATIIDVLLVVYDVCAREHDRHLVLQDHRDKSLDRPLKITSQHQMDHVRVPAIINGCHEMLVPGLHRRRNPAGTSRLSIRHERMPQNVSVLLDPLCLPRTNDAPVAPTDLSRM